MLLLLLLLLCLLPPVSSSKMNNQEVVQKERRSHEEVAVTTRPHIYYCRSPSMEDFSCWWHPLDNLTDGEQVEYVLTYSSDKGPRHECPDYTTSGPNSCHFDRSHTSIWKIYCLNVTAVTGHGNYSSQQHCLDVADIVQTEAPVNLSYVLMDAGGDEMGHNVLLSWTYPVPADLQYGWITLVYELQYRQVTEPDNWKVKHHLRERHLELLGLPVGDYVVRVRCRSHNYGLWSKWSATLFVSIPARPPAGKLLVLILVTVVGVVALLVLAFGVIPQGKRIKDYFLPPIPEPRILGIDSLLLKKGNLDEINHHFSSFHSYRAQSCTEDVKDQLSTNIIHFTSLKVCGVPADTADREKDVLMVPCDLTPVAGQHLGSYVQSLPPYCSSPHDAFGPSLCSRPEMVSLPGAEYSIMGHPDLPNAVPAPLAANCSPQDFYTCVQLMDESGEVHLVPCLPPAYCQEAPPPQEDQEEKKKKLAALQAQTDVRKDGGEAERSEAAVPLLPVATDNKS